MNRPSPYHSFKRYFPKVLALLLVVVPLSLRAALWTGTGYAISGNVSITAFSLSTTSPCPGDSLTVTYTICGTNAGYMPGGRSGIAIKDTALNTTQFQQPSAVGQWMPWVASGAINPPMTIWNNSVLNGGYNENLSVPLSCKTISHTITIPTDVAWGGTYNVILAYDDSYLNDNWTTHEVHLPITICTPNSNQRSLIKSAEGTAAAGEKMIYWLDYTVSNDTNIVVTDNLNSNLIFLDGSPGYTGVTANQACACTVSWNLGNADGSSTPPYVRKGRLWVYVQVKPGTPVGTAINNTAVIDGNSTGPLNSNAVNLVTGSGINVSVAKQQLDASGTIPIASAKNGDTVTYRLYFTLSGLGLKCFSDFDELTNGTNYNGTAPPNWSPIGQDGNPATLANWQVQTRPGTAGDHFLKATTTNYALLQDDCPASHNAQGNFCEGTIITEAYMGTTATDLGIALRENGQSGANWRGVWLLMSKDTSFGTGCSGNLAIQVNNGAARTVVGCYTAPTPPDSGAWYTIKAFIQKEGCNYRYRAKYWVQGTPEPAGWFVDYLDTTNNCNTDFECAGGAGMNPGWAWRPGFGNQGDVNAFDNWRVLANNFLQDAHLYDTVPVGIDYVANSASPTAQVVPSGSGNNEGMVQWDFTGSLNGAQSGKTYDASGYMQWQGVADCSESTSANNTGMLSATNPGGPWPSNTTNLAIVCGTPTFTNTVTFTRTPTPTSTATPTSSVTPSPTPSRTATPTYTITVVTPTFTITPTFTATSTRTITPSPSFTATSTATPSITPSRTATPTYTITVVTSTSTITPSRTVTPTFTATVTQSYTSSATPSRTVTPTFTATATDTPTQSPGPSATSTDTPSASSTPTPSRTVTLTRTATPTFTPTATATPSQSPGPSATNTDTPSSTDTATATYSVTMTRTATPTFTPTATASPTESPGPSATDTDTLTDTRTATPTFSVTLSSTPTPSFTPTRTASPTFTESPANSPTNTPTFTETASDTPTRTITVTQTESSTRTVTPSATPTFTQSVTRTDTRTITVTSTFTQSPTHSPTPVAMPHTVFIAAYNSAGERVRILYSGAAQYQLGDLKFSAASIVGGSTALTISFPGVLKDGSGSLVWDGTNDNAGALSGGVYTIKAEITDNFGQVTSLVQEVQVLPGGAQQFVRIFNSAGETVREIRLGTVKGAADLRVGDGNASFGLEIDPATGAATQDYKIEVLGNGGYTVTGWNGLNDQGLPVDNGTYVIQLVSQEAGREVVVTSRSVTVLKGADSVDATASAFLGPNPVLPSNAEIALYYDPSKLGGKQAACRVYSLAGELVADNSDPKQTGKIVISPIRSLASGTYLVRFEVREGAAVYKARLLKLAIVR